MLKLVFGTPGSSTASLSSSVGVEKVLVEGTAGLDLIVAEEDITDGEMLLVGFNGERGGGCGSGGWWQQQPVQLCPRLVGSARAQSAAAQTWSLFFVIRSLDTALYYRTFQCSDNFLDGQ